MKCLFLLICLCICHQLFSQERYSVVISEIMYDPTPQIGLPNNEWIELTNTSTETINLQGWRIRDESGQSGALPNYVLAANSAVVICTGSAVAALSTFGSTISVTSFPSLSNEGETISLHDATGKTIHAVAYKVGWHENAIKADGGWTLEKIDLRQPCWQEGNWTSSKNNIGGTPGQPNSVAATINDEKAPQLIRAYFVNPLEVRLLFDEPLDSSTATIASQFVIDGGMIISHVECMAPLFTELSIHLQTQMEDEVIYSIITNNISDCKGNKQSTAQTASFAIPQLPQPGDWIINEILFNPRPNGVDYVEFQNKSDKVFDASQLVIANRNGAGEIASQQFLSTVPFLIFPGEYITVTTNKSNIQLEYLVKNEQWLLELNSMPSFPDVEGTVVALNFTGAVIDELHYSKDWHFKLLDNDEGVSLERIYPASPTQDASNWHSAASSVGYGTPTERNSQHINGVSSSTSLSLSSEVFSPDGDGFQDILSLQYSFEENNFLATVTIFDVKGRLVRQLIKNELVNTTGYWNWDGLGDKRQALPIGHYVIVMEAFNSSGKKLDEKKTVVLARKMQ